MKLEEQKWKVVFLDAELSREGIKFVTIAYSKRTFSIFYSNYFLRFLRPTYKFGMIYTFAFRS